MPFAKEAWPFVLPFIVVGTLLIFTDWRKTGIAILVVGLAVLLFFRIPRRHVGGSDSTLLAPACGHITGIEEVEDPLVGPGTHTRIVTFLSVFDVHVQRSPAPAKVVATQFQSGRKVAAFRADAGEVNESQLTVFELESGDRIGVRQIAGLLARRVVGYLEEGDTVERGELMGVIKFGSRVDLLVPSGYEVLVSKGQKVDEGLTPVARPQSSTS
jgi:phosphatidylserine decarboxylase